MSTTNDSSAQVPAEEPRRSSGRYRYQRGEAVNPNEGVHPEMVDSQAASCAGPGIPNTPQDLIAMQESRPEKERPEKPERQQSTKVKEVLDLIEKLETTAAEDQEIAMTLVRRLESFHDEMVDELKDDETAKHSQIVSWAIDADRLYRCRMLLDSVDLE